MFKKVTRDVVSMSEEITLTDLANSTISARDAKSAGDARDAGFTFIETLAVLAITVILTAGISLSVSRYIEKAKVASAKNQIEVYKMALQTYYLDCGSFPSDLQGLQSLWEKPYLSPVPDNWNGPYIDKVVSSDPWGSDYKYTTKTNTALPFEITSFGADKMQGGSANDADIFSWK